jgi:L-asparaginase II
MTSGIAGRPGGRWPPSPSDTPASVPVAEVTRSGAVESVHHGVVVTLAAGGTQWCVGDPMQGIYPRSALKPLQAAAMLHGGLRVDDPGLAVACASHNGEPMHVEVVRRLLASVGLDETALQNTATYPLQPQAARDVVRAGEGPTSIRQNCSGKHAAMLATAVANGWSTDGYLDATHPVQQLIIDYVAGHAGGVMHMGIDGCGAPTALVPLLGLARAMQSLAQTGGRVHASMTSHPDLVAGEDRDATRLMRAVPGLVAKDGAEGIFVAAMPDGRAVAVKITDGGDRARLPVTLAALASLDVDVEAVTVAPILGHGLPVGEIRPLVGV